MTWFVQLQHVNQILADREREASQRRLARQAFDSERPDWRRPAIGLARRLGARLALIVGRFATRVAAAVDSEAVRVA